MRGIRTCARGRASGTEQYSEFGPGVRSQLDPATDLTAEREQELHAQALGLAEIDIGGKADSVVGDDQLKLVVGDAINRDSNFSVAAFGKRVF